MALTRLSAGADPLALAVAQAHIELAPEDALGADVAAPAVVNVVFELAFVDEVLTLSPNTLQPPILVHLPERTLGIVLGDPQMVIDRIVRRCIPDDVFGVEDSELIPFCNTLCEGLCVVQGCNHAIVVLGLGLEFIHQFLRKLWRSLHRDSLRRWPIALICKGLYWNVSVASEGRHERLC